MTYPVVRITVTGDDPASVDQAREVIDRALTAAGFPPHRPRHLQPVPLPADGSNAAQNRSEAS